MTLKRRLHRLEALNQIEEVTKLWMAIEDDHTPGLYHLDDGRTLTEVELDALPSKGPGLRGLSIQSPYHWGHREP